MRPCTATADLLMITFDSLRYDVAEAAWNAGETPYLRELLPQGWEPRHSPGSFTYAAHAAFFAGFWPTPCRPGGEHERPFVLQFPGARFVGEQTTALGGENIVQGLKARGYRTVCIGGTGFFNPATPLGAVFPAMFDESHWRPEFAVTEFHSARAQVQAACLRIEETPVDQPLFLFLNLTATHPPTSFYLAGGRTESVETQRAALETVDRALPKLFAALRQRENDGHAYLMSDHGTLFGEDGFTGHRVGHPTVWTVPYAEVSWEASR